MTDQRKGLVVSAELVALYNRVHAWLVYQGGRKSPPVLAFIAGSPRAVERSTY